MPRLTITEALAELKTLDKRILAKQGSIPNYLVRDDRVRDPLAKDGGSDSLHATKGWRSRYLP